MPYRFSNFPVPGDPESYRTQPPAFARKAAELCGGKLAGVYAVGETDLPGVSDVDLVLVVDGGVPEGALTALARTFPLLDAPAFIRKDRLPELARRSHHLALDPVWVRPGEIPAAMPDRGADLSLVLAWKTAFFSLLRNVGPALRAGKVDVKKCLSWGNDLRYPLAHLRAAGVTEGLEAAEAFAAEFRAFRAAWFVHRDADGLTARLGACQERTWEVLAALAARLPAARALAPLTGRYPTAFLPGDDWAACRKITDAYGARWPGDRFLALPCRLDWRAWEGPLKDELARVLETNPGFLPLSFSSPALRLALAAKKLADAAKIRIFLSRHAAR